MAEGGKCYREKVIRSKIRSIESALPLASSIFTRAAFSIGPPEAGSKRTAVCRRNRRTTPWAFMPMIESSGPGHANIRNERRVAAQHAFIGGLHMGMIPNTALAWPSTKTAKASFSLVVSRRGNRRSRCSLSSLSSSTAALPSRKGRSMISR